MTVTAGDLTQFNEIRSGASYLSQNDLRLHFGLGEQTSINNIEISWPSGNKEKLSDLSTDMIYTIVEGTGVTDKIPLAGSGTGSPPTTAKKAGLVK